jgi:hypothetical protein
MNQNDIELRVTLERIATLQRQLEPLRRVERNPANYRASAAGFLAEIDRMNLEVREYFTLAPDEAGPAMPSAVGTSG